MADIEVTRDGGVATVTINRPQRKNAVTGEMWGQLAETFRALSADTTVRCVVITGAGGEFCSGADLSARTAGERPVHQLVAMRSVNDAALSLHRMPQPTIAKVRGVAVGAGCNLALGCDLVVAGETARFGEIFAKRGLSVDFGGTWLLPRRIGMHRAKELALFGDIISSTDAHELGLVNRVLPDAELDSFVDDWARKLAAGPPIALALTKRMLNNSLNVTMEEALDDEGAAQTVNFGTKDTMEAMEAFVQKREPKFKGY